MSSIPRHFGNYLFFLILTVCTAGSLAKDTLYDEAVVPQGNDNFYEAKTRLLVPDSVVYPSAVLVFLGGTDSDARATILDPTWRAFAEAQNVALLGCYFRGDGEPYENAADGSGDALEVMLGLLERKSGMKGLAKLPLLIIGHSAGAMFAYNFTRWKPSGVLAFVSIKSGPIATEKNGNASTSVPGLFIVGENDVSKRVRTVACAYLEASKGNQTWTFALEPGGKHGSSREILELTRAYLGDMLFLAKKHRLRTGEERVGDCGMFRSLREPLSEERKRDLGLQDVTWLPGEATAALWKAFVKPVNLTEFSRSGGEREKTVYELTPTVLDFGTIEKHGTTTLFERSFILKASVVGNLILESGESLLQVVKFERQENGLYVLKLIINATHLEPGIFRREIGVSFNSESGTPLEVKGLIVSEYGANPSSIYVGVIPKGKVFERQITVFSGAGAPAQIASINSSRPEFASGQQVEDGAIRCRFDGNNGLGNQSGHFNVVLAGSPQRILKVPFVAWVSRKTSL